jgi:hypothetical protein
LGIFKKGREGKGRDFAVFGGQDPQAGMFGNPHVAGQLMDLNGNARCPEAVLQISRGLLLVDAARIPVRKFLG